MMTTITAMPYNTYTIVIGSVIQHSAPFRSGFKNHQYSRIVIFRITNNVTDSTLYKSTNNLSNNDLNLSPYGVEEQVKRKKVSSGCVAILFVSASALSTLRVVAAWTN